MYEIINSDELLMWAENLDDKRGVARIDRTALSNSICALVFLKCGLILVPDTGFTSPGVERQSLLCWVEGTKKTRMMPSIALWYLQSYGGHET